MLYMTRTRISCQNATKGSSNFGLVKEQRRLIAAIDMILVFVLVFALVRRDPRVFWRAPPHWESAVNPTVGLGISEAGRWSDCMSTL